MRMRKKIYSKLPRDWEKALRNNGFVTNNLYKRLHDLYGQKNSGIITPSVDKVFRAFHETPLRKVRIVVIGEDPYPNVEHADGLAFSIPNGIKQDRRTSIYKILDALKSDVKIEAETTDLTQWARRGILLINTKLTHSRNNNDKDIWKPFTASILNIISARNRKIVWLIMGNKAKITIEKANLLKHQKHLLIINAHPGARNSNIEAPTLIDQPPFSKASKYLMSNQAKDWSLNKITCFKQGKKRL